MQALVAAMGRVCVGVTRGGGFNVTQRDLEQAQSLEPRVESLLFE